MDWTDIIVMSVDKAMKTKGVHLFCYVAFLNFIKILNNPLCPLANPFPPPPTQGNPRVIHSSHSGI